MYVFSILNLPKIENLHINSVQNSFNVQTCHKNGNVLTFRILPSELEKFVTVPAICWLCQLSSGSGTDLQKWGPRAKSLTGGPHSPTNTFKIEKQAVYSQNYIHFFNKGPFSANNYDFKFQNTKCVCVFAIINSLFLI